MQAGNPWHPPLPLFGGLAMAAHMRGRIRDNVQMYEPVAPSNPFFSTSARASMPRRSYSRTVTRKKKRQRRGGRGPRRPVSLQWPRFKLVKFKVVTQFSVNSSGGTGAIQQVILNCSGIADPHNAIGGNLPLGLDQWAAMYAKYAVVKAKHFVKVHNVSSTGAVSYGLTIRAPGETSLLTNAEQYLELPMTRSRILSPDMDHSGLGITYVAKKYFHVRKFMDAEYLHGGLSTTPTDPARTVSASFWFEDVNRSTDFTLEGYVTSEYTCLLFDPIRPTRSSL